MMIFSPKQTEIMSRAVLEYGGLQQSDIAIEELAELQQAIIKHRRYGTEEARQHIIEEIADCSIMLYQLLLIFGFDGLDAITDAKLQRLQTRLDRKCGYCAYFCEQPFEGTTQPSGWGHCTKYDPDLDRTIVDTCENFIKKEVKENV